MKRYKRTPFIVLFILLSCTFTGCGDALTSTDSLEIQAILEALQNRRVFDSQNTILPGFAYARVDDENFFVEKISLKTPSLSANIGNVRFKLGTQIKIPLSEIEFSEQTPKDTVSMRGSAIADLVLDADYIEGQNVLGPLATCLIRDLAFSVVAEFPRSPISEDTDFDSPIEGLTLTIEAIVPVNLCTNRGDSSWPPISDSQAQPLFLSSLYLDSGKL